jgi:hypothetical protein
MCTAFFSVPRPLISAPDSSQPVRRRGDHGALHASIQSLRGVVVTNTLAIIFSRDSWTDVSCPRLTSLAAAAPRL